MRRLAALILAICLLSSLSACSGESPAALAAGPEEVSTEIPVDEWERALWYGFVPADAGDPDSPVTWAQFCGILGNMIARYDESKLEQWEADTADAPEEEIRRDGAMISLLFAAKAMGIATFNAPYTMVYGEYVDRMWEVVSRDYPVFDWDTPVDLGEDCVDSNHIGPSYDYCQRRASLVTGFCLLEEEDTSDLRLEDPLTLREGGLAALRLYESDEVVGTQAREAVMAAFYATPEVQEIFNQVDARREAIRSSETEIVKGDTFIKGGTYTGTAYYVSNNGSDSNDGRSPETPLATLAALDKLNLQYGDAVFFERGSVWRCERLPESTVWAEGVTFSAYGEGEKPQFLGSVENGGGGEKWTLAYEDEDGKKIWAYYRTMTEVAAIVLNHDTVICRDKAYWNGSEYLVVDENYFPVDGDIPYTVEEYLPDMYCFPDLRFDQEQGPQDDCIFRTWNQEENRYDYVEDTFYFRCDAGNPGELYSDIEFIQPYALINGYADDQVYDNLCILFSAETFTSGSYNGISTGLNSVIQNMELGFMGGNVTGYLPAEGSDDNIRYNNGSFGCNGGAISINGSGITARNNYVHHAFQEGIAIELFVEAPSIENCTISGNLIEYCTQALILCNWDMEVREDHIFRNILVEDNLVLYAGYENWYNDDAADAMCSNFILQGGPCAHDGTVVVKNNTFAFATGGVVLLEVYTEEYSRILQDNVYVRHPDGDGVNTVWTEEHWSLEKGVGLLGDAGAVIIEG